MTILSENKARQVLQFTNCIDSALDVFGDSFKHVVYWNLERSFGVKREEIALKPRKFEAIIDKIFGAGADTVKKILVRRITEIIGSRNEENSELDAVLKQAYKHFIDTE